MIKDLVEFKKYIAENKIFVFVSLIISILIYYLKMTTPIIGMDTNGFLFDQEGYNKHWLSIGRVGEVLIKKYIWRGNNNIFLWNTVSCLLFTFSVVFFSFMLSKIINDRKHLRLLLPCLILSSPLFVFQYYFVLQMFE
ncbi:glucosyltransferase domain-containing protein, partial [Enterococcus cecorum]